MSFTVLRKSFLILLLYSISILSYSSAQENLETEVSTVGLEEYDYPFPDPEICEPREKCVKKCCPEGNFLMEYQCVNESTIFSAWRPPSGVKTRFTILHGLPSGETDDFCGEVEKENYELNESSGKVLYKTLGKEFDSSLYCLENKFNEKTNEVTEFALICYPITKKNSFDHWTDTFHKIGLSISVVCLAVILALYAATPGKNELKMQSKCIISSCFNLLVAFLLVLTNMTKNVTSNISQIPCVILAIALQFFFLSFYFWLNAMIYDISRIISGTMNLKRMASLEKNKLRFAMYALYAWGCPAVISIITIIMQVESKNLGEGVIKPHIGDGRCWFKEKGGSIYAYYYGIEVFLHIINAGLILHCLYLLKGQNLVENLCLGKRNNATDTFNMRCHATKNHYDFFWQQFSTYILYICVWIMNSVTLIYSREKFWRFIDIAVSLQGLFLLIIVVKFGNNLLTKAWNKLKEATKSLTTSTSTFDLTELSSNNNQKSESNTYEQKVHTISER